MQKVILNIRDGGKPFEPTTLGEFLFLFRGVAVALSSILPTSIQDEWRDCSPKDISKYRRLLSELPPLQLDKCFDPATKPRLMRIQKISCSSPLEIVLLSNLSIIVLAVVFSGGKLSLLKGVLSAELPPLGTGIKSLREALALDRTVKAGFGIRSVTIRLNKAEYIELLRQPRGQGGWQTLLLRLQNRVNKQTRELELSPEDLERIHAAKSDPRRGGFQGRFNKIFGRHFPSDHSG